MKKNDYLDTYGFKVLKVSKYITNTISKGILKNIHSKFPRNDLVNFKKQINFVLNLTDKEFKENFGKNPQRILDYKTNKIVNEWVKKKITKELNCKKASLNMISKYDLQNNTLLKKDQFNVFFRIVRKNKNDVGYPHRDSSFWKLGKLYSREAPFKYKQLWKFWIPIFGVNKMNSLRLIKESHKDKIALKYKKVDNYLKPLIPESYIKKNHKKIIVPIKNFDGKEGILFHCDTVHFGPKNKITKCRISAEFNILVS